MTRPAVTEHAERLYAGLPEVYRDADAAQAAGANGYPLLRYVSLVADQLAAGDLGALNELDLDGLLAAAEASSTSPAWLAWLAQFAGLDLDTTQARADQVDEVAGAATSGRWLHGTAAAIAALAAAALSGTQAVEISRHYGGDPWLVGVGTLDAETPTLDTWADLEGIAGDPPTWAGLELGRTWDDLRHLPVVAAAAAECPAGVRLVRYSTD